MNHIRQTARQPIFLIFFVFICFSVFGVLLTFSSTPSAPQLKFTKWKAGQGQEYTTSNPLHTFITDTETTCKITATVAYASSQPSSVYPLTGYTWQVTGSHGYTFTTQTETSGPVGQTGTTFTLTATGTGNQHNSSSGGHRPMRGRSEKPIKFTVKFIGEYGSGSGSDPQTVEVEVVFEQDEKDQMRQEYLDVRRLHETHRTADKNRQYGDLRVPGREAFTKSGQRFNDGHYSYLINKSLETKILHWWQACDKYAYEELENDDLKNDEGKKKLRLTGGYRNPHHHVYHVYAGQSMSDVAYWSLHQFGLALDVGDMDMDGKNGIEGGYNGKDGNFMELAAREHAGASWTSNNYRSQPHVHAQWGAVRNAPGGTSTSSQRSTQTSTTNTENPVTTPPETTPTTVMGACGVHTIASSEASSHVEKTGACGDTYYVCSQGDHSLQASCSTDSNCISTNFYFCQHTGHTYSQQACGHTYNPGSSSANSHRSVTHPCGRHSYYACQTLSSSEANRHTYQTMPCGNHRFYPCRMTSRHKRTVSCPTQNGVACSYGSYYPCSPHTHAYPSPNNNNNGNSGNGNSDNSGDSGSSGLVTCGAARWTGCSGASSRTAHYVSSCSSGCGSGYWTCNPSAIERHETSHTCTRSGCGASYTRCTKNDGSCSGGRYTWHK